MKLLENVSLGIWFFVVIYFGYFGFTTLPSELDSIGYHIPIAESVLDGSVFKPDYVSPYSYYPGMGETILAIFGVLRLPFNLFNVLGLVLLFVVVMKLGERAGLSADEAVILGTAISLLPTVLRLPMTQLVDVWLAVWWGWWLWLAEKPEKQLRWQLIFGLVSGFLVGTKISGIMLLGCGLIFYWKKILSWTWILIGATVGGFWYIRNWVNVENPFYPLDFWVWKGHPVAKLPIVWKFLWHENGWLPFLQALTSEFLGWALVLLAPIKVWNKWIGLGLINFGLFFVMPGSLGTIVSNSRYLIPAIMTLSLGVWLLAKKKKWNENLAVFAVINSAMVLPQLEFKPKIVLISLAILGVYLKRRKT